MMRHHLLTALLLVLHFEEGTTDAKDDCFNYDKVFSWPLYAVFSVTEQCPPGRCDISLLRSVAEVCLSVHCIDDFAEAFRCITNSINEKSAKKRPMNVDDMFNAFEEYGNPDKLDALKMIRDKCTKDPEDIEYSSNCTVYMMADICPDDEFFKEDEDCF